MAYFSTFLSSIKSTPLVWFQVLPFRFLLQTEKFATSDQKFIFWIESRSTLFKTCVLSSFRPFYILDDIFYIQHGVRAVGVYLKRICFFGVQSFEATNKLLKKDTLGFALWKLKPQSEILQPFSIYLKLLSLHKVFSIKNTVPNLGYFFTI